MDITYLCKWHRWGESNPKTIFPVKEEYPKPLDDSDL